MGGAPRFLGWCCGDHLTQLLGRIATRGWRSYAMRQPERHVIVKAPIRPAGLQHLSEPRAGDAHAVLDRTVLLWLVYDGGDAVAWFVACFKREARVLTSLACSAVRVAAAVSCSRAPMAVKKRACISSAA